MSKNFKWIALACVANALVLSICTVFFLKSSGVRGDEKALIQFSSYFKNLVLKKEKKPASSELLFVNVSYDNQLVDILDADGFPMGNRAITDRAKLARFFQLLNEKPGNHRYVLCDIFFGDKTAHDQKLGAELKKLPNVVIPFHIDNAGKVQNPVFDANKGLADYKRTVGELVKYNLQKGEHKSLPLKMYLDLHGGEWKSGKFFGNVGNGRILKNFIMNFPVRHHDLKNKTYPVVNLGELLTLPPAEFYKMVKGRIIVMSDLYETDLHQTIYGDMSGGVALLNAYLALANKDNAIGVGLFVWLFIFYALISFLVFDPKCYHREWFSRYLEKARALEFALGWINFCLILMIVSVFTYLLFNVHINILYFSIYLYLMDIGSHQLYRKYGVFSQKQEETKNDAQSEPQVKPEGEIA